MADDNNPLIKALPPETDYLTYLTIIEYNLTIHQLPILHQILQDITLTSNIGWDLVHVLLPLLPASEQCLRDVARLGNPREVVLKVTELLEALAEEIAEDEVSEGDVDSPRTGDGVGERQNELGNGMDENPNGRLAKSAVPPESSSSSPPSLSIDESSAGPSPALKFAALMSMLSVLHPRIKTKYPSRFLSTAVQAMLPAYKQVARYPGTIDAVLGFIKTLSGTKRPNLPPRMSSTSILISEKLGSAPDPEASFEPSGSEEIAIQARLLQSALTRIAEVYVQSLPSIDDVHGLAWATRLQEKSQARRSIPGRETAEAKFTATEGLHERDAIIGQLIALARDLNINPRELLFVIVHRQQTAVEGADNLPSSPSDVSLSHNGSLYLLAAMLVASILFEAPSSLPIDVFPVHSGIVESFIGDEAMNGIGSEPETLVDSVLALGYVALRAKSLGNVSDDQSFNRYLQRLSLLSANTPSSTLRYCAHVLVSTILHSHPLYTVRFNFIRDTLEYCPYENLKASAVGWLKDEILAAATPHAEGEREHEEAVNHVFASPASIDSVASFLFPPINVPEQEDDISSFSIQIPFFLSALNLYYLLCISQSLRDSLEVASLDHRHNIGRRFIEPLGRLGCKFGNQVLASLISEWASENDMAGVAEMQLLQVTAEQAWTARERLGGSRKDELLYDEERAVDDGKEAEVNV